MKKKLIKFISSAGLLGAVAAGLNLLEKRTELKIVETEIKHEKSVENEITKLLSDFKNLQNQYLEIFNKHSANMNVEENYDWTNRFNSIAQNFHNGLTTNYTPQMVDMKLEMEVLLSDIKKEYGE